MRLVIRPSESDAAEWAALYVKQRITSFAPTQEKPFVLGLCTGTTMLGMYKVVFCHVSYGDRTAGSDWLKFTNRVR